MHLEEEQLQRLLHDEISMASDRDHVEGCSECRRRLDEARREQGEVDELLRHLDQAPPNLEAHEISVLARRHDRVRMQWAAGLGLLLALGGAVYAAPGSPLRSWVAAILEPPAPRTDPSRSAPHPNGSDRNLAGVAVAPGSDLVILFTSLQTEGHIRVTLTDETDVVVRAPGAAATFTSDAERLVIDNRGSRSSFDIQVPRAATRVEIRTSGERVFLKEGSRVISVNGPRTQDAYDISLVPSRP